MITLDKAKERLNSYYFPYHESLKKMVNETKQQFGSALLIDCHSMPKSAVKGLERFKYKGRTYSSENSWSFKYYSRHDA